VPLGHARVHPLPDGLRPQPDVVTPVGYLPGMSIHPDEPNQGPLVEPDQDPIPPGEDPADDPSPEPDLA
jgi:hypothetical protein